jgi:hypothetical protein
VQREYFWPTTPAEWRQWLEENGQRRREIWLLFPLKHTGKPGISYYEALEEALCFGWIDGMVARHDTGIIAHRFSPRSAKSSWSEVNKQHARLLIARGKMTPPGHAALPDLDPAAYVPPADILEELRRDPAVWENFCAFPAYYRNIRIAGVDNYRRWPERFRRTLDHLIAQTRKNGRYGRFR